MAKGGKEQSGVADTKNESKTKSGKSDENSCSTTVGREGDGKIDGREMEIQRVHRLYTKKPGSKPIKVRLLRFADKQQMLRNASKLHGKPQAHW